MGGSLKGFLIFLICINFFVMSKNVFKKINNKIMLDKIKKVNEQKLKDI